jgi:hypothetical protein
MHRIAKGFLTVVIAFVLGVIVSWAFLSATAEVQERRELAAASQCDRELASCTTGQHCQVKGRDLLTITSRGAR